MKRHPRVVGIARDRTASIELRTDQVAGLESAKRTYDFTVLLVADDDELVHPAPGPDTGLTVVYKRGFQETQRPCELLFEGDWDALNEAVTHGAFDRCCDEVTWLERVLLVRDVDGQLDHSRSPSDVLSHAETPAGRWWAILADGPWDAFAHVRDHQDLELDEDGTCPECFVAVEQILEDSATAVRFCERRQSAERQGHDAGECET